MNTHLKIRPADLVRAIGQDPATYVIPTEPTPEDFLNEPTVTVFYRGFRPVFAAYTPLHAWFGGCGADHLREWRKAKGPKRDKEAFEAWVKVAIWGNRVGLGCDMLDLNKPTDRFDFASALDVVDGTAVPLAVEFMRIHCLSKAPSHWTLPKGKERLGTYRAEVEAGRARACPSLPSKVDRGLPDRFATPELEEAARRVANAATAKGLCFDRLVFEPTDDGNTATLFSHVYVVADPASIAAAAKSRSVEEAKRVLGEDASFVRVYGEIGCEEISEALKPAFEWLRSQAEFAKPIAA